MRATAAPLTLSGDELERILEIEVGAFPHPWTMADFQWLSRDERSLNLGLWHGDTLMGYAIATVNGAELHLASVAVDAPWRRQGWGSRLLRAILTRAADRGCHSCRLEVRESNQAAISMYEKFRFVADGVQRRFYTNPVEDARLLRRDLCVDPEPQSTVAG